jgi:hypothetical protein
VVERFRLEAGHGYLHHGGVVMTVSASFASSDALAGLVSAIDSVTDPRARRGVRHPFSGILALVFLGLLGRFREMAVLERWAATHWDQLPEPLCFTRKKTPCDTSPSH